MSQQEKSIEELEEELHQLHQKVTIRKLPIDQSGSILLDDDNPDDAEWYYNDEKYNVFYEK